MLKKSEPILIYFCFFLLFINSMGCWIGWNGRKGYINIILSLMIIVLLNYHHIRLNFDKRNIIAFILLVITYIWSARGVPLGAILSFFLPAALIIFQKDNFRFGCLKFIFKYFAILMIPSIIVFAIVETLGIPAIDTLIVFPESEEHVQGAWYQYRNNYLFYTPYTKDYFAWNRFLGPFTEPGHLGTILAFLLFVDGFSLKNKYTRINMIALILTFSLAGYILAFVGFLFDRFTKKKLSLWIIMSLCSLLLLIIAFANFYKNGDNVLNEKVVSRMELDDNRGIAGNHRVSDEVDFYFVMMLEDSKILLQGYDEKTIDYLYYTGGGTGIKMWIVCHGLIGVISVLAFYYAFCFFSNYRKLSFFYFVFVFLLFIQRSYPFWFAWIICYVYGISVLENSLRFNNIYKRKIK